jgi:hypothetical protein
MAKPRPPRESTALASAYRLDAANFRANAEVIVSTLSLDVDGRPTSLLALPFYFLVSHAAELLLKAALLKTGVSEAELKEFDLRHSLSGLLSELQKLGPSVSRDTEVLVNGLHRQHLTHALRYTVLVDNGEKTYLPPIPAVYEVLDELLLLTRISTQGM